MSSAVQRMFSRFEKSSSFVKTNMLTFCCSANLRHEIFNSKDAAMSKRGQKKQKGEARRANSPYASHNISTIDQHLRVRNKFIPPMAQLPKMKTSSWIDHHMPEMLWAVLLTGTLKRTEYLDCFRQLAALCRNWFLKNKEENTSKEKSDDIGVNFTVIADLTKLAEISDEDFHKFLSIPLSFPLGLNALRPLLLIDSIPGVDRWRRELAATPIDDDWATLAHSVAGVLDHQSEASTDIRWFKVIVPIISGRMFYPPSEANHMEELRLFPDMGDMRIVRPKIRSAEMMMRRTPPTSWINDFWAQTMRETRCIDPSEGEDYVFVDTRIDALSLYAARDGVIKRFNNNINAERVDARLDSAFGLVLFALSVLEEIGMHRINTRILGVFSLRSLAEVCITLHYLEHIDTPAMWQSFRVYGAGQAKLAFLKAQQTHGDLPEFIDESTLHAIANEDSWQEFLDIDVGHWANSNIRKLATDCNAKDIYDKYYDWSSGFIHGNWAALRDTNFVTCHNALHRLHRIPRVLHRNLNSVEYDAIILVNDMIKILERLYPNTNLIPHVTLNSTSSDIPKSDAE